MRYFPLRLAIAAVVFAAGCGSILAPRPDLSKFFILTALEAGHKPIPASATQLAIGLGPVKFPAYLDHNEIVTRVAPNRLEFSETDRWAEPLDSNFRQVLATDVAAQLANAQIVPFPWYGTARLDYKVEVNVDRFERDESGNAQLIAHWTIRDGGTNKLLVARDSRISESAKSAATADSVAAMSAGLEDLSVQIASEVRKLSDQAQSG